MSPTLDADASVAAAVLNHVTSLRDRLALACVSKVWRDAAATEGGVTDVVIEGELAKRLTDERFKRAMDVCSALKRLEVRDAPEDFQALYFFSDEKVLSEKFGNLETLKMKNCRGLDGSIVVDLMETIGMNDKPKHERLERLHLAGSKVFHRDAMMLPEFVRAPRVENYLAYRREPEGDHEGVDLWGCAACCGIFDEGEGCCDPDRCERMEIEEFGDPCECPSMRRAMKAHGIPTETWSWRDDELFADMCPICTRCLCGAHQFEARGRFRLFAAGEGRPMITNEQCSWNPQTLRESAEANGDVCRMCMAEKGDDFSESDFDEPDFYESDFYESDFDDFPPPEEPPFQIIIRDLRNRQDAD
jgi:hypothetical protein